MPHIRTTARAECQKGDKEEKVPLAQINMNSDLKEFNQMATRYQEEVKTRLKLVRGTTDPQELPMEWSDIVVLKIDHFSRYPRPAPSAPTTRSRSVSPVRGRIRTKQEETWTRVQSLDREPADEDDWLIPANRCSLRRAVR